MKLSARKIILVLAVIVITMAMATQASAESYGDFDYAINSGNVIISGYTGSSPNVTIPKSIDGCPVTTIGTSVFEGKTFIKTVEIPSGVTWIMENAFRDCTGLTSITLPEELTKLDNYAFAGCVNVSRITVNSENLGDIGHWMYAGTDYFGRPFYGVGSMTDGVTVEFADGCTRIPAHMFWVFESEGHVPNITSVIVADSVISMGKGAFLGCKELETVTLGNGLTNISDYAFQNCTSLKSVTFGRAITDIGSYAFLNCKKLENVNLPKLLLTIGESAFENCNAFTAITLPENLITLGNYAFASCNNVSRITVNSENLGDIGHWMYAGTDYFGRPFYGVGTLTDGVTVEFADDCTRIPAHMFWVFESEGHVPNITSVIVADSVTSMGNGAFCGCKELETVTLGNGLTRISDYAFDGCTSLKSVTFGRAITDIGSYAFFNCTKLGNVDLPKSLLSTGESVFENCTAFTSITLPENLKVLGTYAFADCDNVTQITVKSKYLDDIGQWMYSGVTYYGRPFYDVGSLTDGVTVEFADGCTRIPAHMFWVFESEGHVPNITSVIVADSVTSMGKAAFCACNELETVTLGNGLTGISEYAFAECTSLKTVSFGRAVTDIATRAFYGCTKLENVDLPKSLLTTGESVFENCTSFTSITLPENLKVLGTYAFANCDNVTQITVKSKNLDDIGFWRYAGVTYYGRPFYDVGTMTDGVTVEFADGCTRIPAHMFWVLLDEDHAPNITAVIAADSVATVGVGAFQFCDTLKAAAFGRGINVIDDNAFDGCTRLAEIRIPSKTCEIWDADRYGTTLGAPGTTTVYGQLDSPTHTYAVTYGYQFIPLNPFTDVPEDSFYYDPVMWAVENGITSGATATTFNPDGDCLRAQVVTFLWRAAGSPEPGSNVNPFVDVKPSDFYYKAVLWAVENGITTGSDATHFNPMGVCNRAQVVTFLYRAFDAPAVENAVNPFTDVPAGAWYTAPVLWAVENGITNGLSATQFGPNAACNRAQIVTFLYRAYTE